MRYNWLEASPRRSGRYRGYHYDIRPDGFHIPGFLRTRNLENFFSRFTLNVPDSLQSRSYKHFKY